MCVFSYFYPTREEIEAIRSKWQETVHRLHSEEEKLPDLEANVQKAKLEYDKVRSFDDSVPTCHVSIHNWSVCLSNPSNFSPIVVE